MATKIQLRRDTASDWTSTNPTMAAGEFGWESDTNRFKIGDGSTAWTSLGYASEGDTAGITFVGDDSTGTLVNQNETFKVAGGTNITTAVSGDTLTVTGPDLSSYITASSSDTLTNKAGNISQWTNDSGYTTNTGTVTASSSDTFTNKTIDANGTGNSITNLDIDNMTAAVIVTAADTIGSNNNDTTIPTSAAVKAYADSVGGGSATGLTFVGDDSSGTLISDGETVKIAGGTGITTAMSGDTMTITASGGGTITALNNQAENRLTTIGSTTTELDGEANLTFDGSTLAITGAITASTDITATGTIGNDAISLTDNLISTNRSNDNLYIQANGTGRVNTGNVKLEDAGWSDLFGNASRVKGTAMVYEDLSVNPNDLTDREYGHAIYMGTKITADSSNLNFRPRAVVIGSHVELDGFDYTNTSNYRGPLGAQILGAVSNGTSTDVTINTVRAVESSAAVLDFSGTSGDITVVNAIGNMCGNYHERDGTGDINVTNDYGFKFAPDSYNAAGGTGATTITNSYAFHCQANGGDATTTNAYAFYSEDATASSRMGAIRLDNQSGDPTHGADFSWIFAKDEASSSEVFVKDEAGNVTKISPHNAAGDWEYYSKNTVTGKTVRVNMEAMIRDIEGLTGNTYIESE